MNKRKGFDKNAKFSERSLIEILKSKYGITSD